MRELCRAWVERHDRKKGVGVDMLTRHLFNEGYPRTPSTVARRLRALEDAGDIGEVEGVAGPTGTFCPTGPRLELTKRIVELADAEAAMMRAARSGHLPGDLVDQLAHLTLDLRLARAQLDGGYKGLVEALRKSADPASAAELEQVTTRRERARRLVAECDLLADAWLERLSPSLQTAAADRLRARLARAEGYAAEGHLDEALDRLEAIRNQAFALWDCDARGFDPVIQDDLVAASKTNGEYVELLAGAELDFRGEKYNLSSIGKHHVSADRDTRHDSQAAKWGWFADNADALDTKFDTLVKLRDGMAKKLGLKDFVELGYLNMSRIDYSREDVERLRNEVREKIVPLVSRIRQQQAQDLGIDKVAYWDEGVFDKQGDPAPKGDHDWMLVRAQEMFDDIGHGMGDFFRLMNDKGLLDLKAREGKAGGGFCTAFPNWGVPFIFANFNATKHDAVVFTHEVGHAFQNYCSKDQKLADYYWPTYESAEIHSMSLEFITWPWMEKFFEDDADRYRRVHLLGNLTFLPYGCAVDHFQHMIYEKPDATPAERKAMWKECESMYLPDRDYGDLPHVGEGGMWQLQRHIYGMPFYYIDYVIAGICAMQFWVRVEEDRDQAMKDYVALCKRGGEAPFQELARSAGLRSPFDTGCLTAVAEKAESWLGL